MNRNRKIMEGLGSFLLIVMFIVMMITSSSAIISAYYNLQLTNKRIQLSIKNALNRIKEHSNPTNGELIQSEIVRLMQLQSKSKGTLDSSTISFLFQVFTLALISAGVYILKRSFSNIRSSERKIELIRQFINSGPNIYALGNYFSNAYQITYPLKNINDDTLIDSYISLERDYLTIAKNKLERAAQDRIGIERSLHGSFLDYGVRIRSNLNIVIKENTLSQEIKKRISDLIDICNECLELLKTSGFVEKFEEQLAILEDKA